MKKWIGRLSIVLVIGFLLGGTVVAHSTGTSLLEALNTNSEAVQAAPEDVADVNATVQFDLSNGVADIVEKEGPAVVNIEAKVKVDSAVNNPFMNDPFFRQFFGQQLPTMPQDRYETGIGTGFIISKDGYILTNQHVIDNAEEVTVTLQGKDEKIPVAVVGQDYELDLAVLKIEGSNYPTLTLGDSDVMRVGEWVVAIGEPYGLDHTVTTGVVSAKGRPITIEDRNYKNLIQTDAAINPGNSGGPLLNLKGEVIAINTAINSQAEGIGFAIPINTAKDVLEDLMSGKNGEKVIRPFMGIRMTDVNDDVIEELQLNPGTKGAVVLEVVQGSPAAKYGIQYLDIVQKIDGEVVENGSDVQKAIEQKEVGQRITVEILRQGYNVSLPVVLQAKP
ncbi:MAG: trypsin-like peptidase domain-containing protein [Bacillota bacterium]|nr:trypsin-like peptidase domain-containing protein [Bacillota bacterium]